LVSDIEEFLSINKKLIYNIYSEKLNDKMFLQKSKDVNTVRDYIRNAEEYYTQAESYMSNIDTTNSDEKFVRSMRSANLAYNQAITMQRRAIALCSNIDLNIPENTFTSISTYDVPVDNTAQNSTLQNNNEESINNSSNPEVLASTVNSQMTLENAVDFIDNNSKTINQDIVFRIQIGAFINKVNKNDLNGLSPLFIDRSDPKFEKVLIEEHYSYRSAIAALRVIKQTTPYKDAFVVVYCSGERRPIACVMQENNINEVEKNAYITYKNNIE